MRDFDSLYVELEDITEEILPYYDIDKIKPNSVYIWTKGEYGENVFDIYADEIEFYTENHVINKKAEPIIKKIQLKLREIERSI